MFLNNVRQRLFRFLRSFCYRDAGSQFLSLLAFIKLVGYDHKKELNGKYRADKNENEKVYKSEERDAVLKGIHDINPSLLGHDLKDDDERVINIIKSNHSVRGIVT